MTPALDLMPIYTRRSERLWRITQLGVKGGKQPYFFVSTDDGGNYRCINPGAPNLYQMLVTNYPTTFEGVRPLLELIHKANSAIRGVVPPVEFAETLLTTYSKGGS